MAITKLGRQLIDNERSNKSKLLGIGFGIGLPLAGFAGMIGLRRSASKKLYNSYASEAAKGIIKDLHAQAKRKGSVHLGGTSLTAEDMLDASKFRDAMMSDKPIVF